MHRLYSSYDQYVDAVTAMKSLLDGDVSASERVREHQIGPAVDAVERGYSRVKLVGPDDVSAAAQRLRDVVRDHADAVIEWRRRFLQMDLERPEQETSEQRRLRHQRQRTSRDRMRVARERAEELAPATGVTLNAFGEAARDALLRGPRPGIASVDN
ncbi:hypothetical protein KBY19_00010 [Streptomyces sp. B15]|nr:hypothetical protein [Streptomyces sp. B15]